MNTDELHRVYEARALLDKALEILIQANESIQALQPQRESRRNMTTEEMLKQFTILSGGRPKSRIRTKKTKKGAK